MQQILSRLSSWRILHRNKNGYPIFKKYMRSYGLDKKTGIDLPTSHGAILSARLWTEAGYQLRHRFLWAGYIRLAIE